MEMAKHRLYDHLASGIALPGLLHGQLAPFSVRLTTYSRTLPLSTPCSYLAECHWDGKPSGGKGFFVIEELHRKGRIQFLYIKKRRVPDRIEDLVRGQNDPSLAIRRQLLLSLAT